MIELREITMKDALELLQFELKNKLFFEKFVPPRAEDYLTLAGIQKSISSMLESRETDEYYLFLIINNQDRIVGRAKVFTIDRVKGSAEIGFRIAEDQAGKGIMSQAVTQLEKIASMRLGLWMLEAVVMEGNLASKRVLEKSGFRSERFMEKALLFNGEKRDAFLYKKELPV
ncbi:hypothetical protein A8F94_02810 [Bacillus sp. FJAT-27225]|uniref:GNAT family N-acetyltransferase n=1 Tax=Bacillus sp. FJAT-27225 TaxID=1743144 RepID=UPI00080C29E2|nr:GNAT family protein [Bacillus sp. FJAT-27225]OCA90821.1 hypothetical protein A8F94_02810 [Bacillus sp. FJAT-27225]